MSGYINFSNETVWQGSSGLFRVVAEAVAKQLKGTALATEIEEMIEFNLPNVLDLRTLSDTDRSVVMDFLRNHIVQFAEENINRPAEVQERVMERVRKLAEIARTVPEQ